ncbi:MAG: CAP domain-containing protein [Chamaesiphon sp.]|nr:CAP domain-containing protein [Chamaesiphon sp.]
MDLVQKVIALTNQERANHGLRSLEWNEQLFNAAQEHSQGMAHGDFFDQLSLFLLEKIVFCTTKLSYSIFFGAICLGDRQNISTYYAHPKSTVEPCWLAGSYY